MKHPVSSNMAATVGRICGKGLLKSNPRIVYNQVRCQPRIHQNCHSIRKSNQHQQSSKIELLICVSNKFTKRVKHLNDLKMFPILHCGPCLMANITFLKCKKQHKLLHNTCFKSNFNFKLHCYRLTNCLPRENG